MPFLLGSYLDEVRSDVNESVTVRSEERGIYTQSRNLTVQIYVGSFDADLGTSDVNRNTIRKGSEVRACKSVSELSANIGTFDEHS